MPCAGRDENRVARRDFSFDPVDLHDAAPASEIVEFLTDLVVMPLDFRAGRQARFSEALIFDRSIREIQQAPDGGPIFGGERDLLLAVTDFHIAMKSPMPAEINP